jgi:hypothetical protein
MASYVYHFTSQKNFNSTKYKIENPRTTKDNKIEYTKSLAD